MRVLMLAALIIMIGSLGTLVALPAYCLVPLPDLAQRAHNVRVERGSAALAQESVAAGCQPTTSRWEVAGYQVREASKGLVIVLRETAREAALFSVARLLEAFELARFEELWISLEPSRRDVSFHEFEVRPGRVADTAYLQAVAPVDVQVKREAVEWLDRYLTDRTLTQTGAYSARAFFVPHGGVGNRPGGFVEIVMTAKLVPDLIPGGMSKEFRDALQQFTDQYNERVATGAVTSEFEELVRQYRINLLGSALVEELESEPSMTADRDLWMSMAREAPRVDSPPPVEVKSLRITSWPLHYSPVRVIVVGGILFSSGGIRNFVAARDASPGASFTFDGERMQALTVWQGLLEPSAQRYLSASRSIASPLVSARIQNWSIDSVSRSAISSFNFNSPLHWSSLTVHTSSADYLLRFGSSQQPGLPWISPSPSPRLPWAPQPQPRPPINPCRPRC